MSVPLTAPSTATEVKTSEGPLKVPAFKHPLDPLTPEEVRRTRDTDLPHREADLDLVDRRCIAQRPPVCRGEDRDQGG